MSEGVFEDLLPFLLMLGGMVVMGAVALFMFVRRALEDGIQPPDNSQTRDQEGSAAMGSTFNG